MKTGITAKRLRNLLAYDATTGIFVWRVTRSRKAPAGAVAGYVNQSGYRHIIVDGEEYKAHRLAWLHVTGKWARKRIDHADGDLNNNRFSNLREATHSQNLANSRLRRDNKVGLKGVCQERTTGRWMANINKDGRRHYLGLFDSPEEAHAAYCDAAARLHGEFARAA